MKTGSVARLIEAVSARTGFSKTYVEQRARYLQAGAQLRVPVGARQPSATPRDCATLLFALVADRAAHASHAAGDFERRVGGRLESLIERIWNGDREAVDFNVTLWKHPQLQFHLCPRGARPDIGNADLTRVGLTIPGVVIAAIGADIGHKACRRAASGTNSATPQPPHPNEGNDATKD